MIIIMLGAPGAGKGTIGKRLSKELDITHLSSGDIFRTLIESKARKFYIFHNHTSGNSSPSEIDCFITASLISSADKIGIKLVDHIIVGREMYYSFAIKANRYFN